MRITNRPAATGTAFLSMFFLGVGVAIVGATARGVGLAPAEIGYLLAAQNVGFGVAVVAGGALSDLYRKSVILTVGLVILGASFAVLYRSPVFGVNLAVMVLMGIGMGAVEAVTDALLLEMHTRNESRYVTINHFFVSFGMVGITLYLMALALDWSASLAQVAVALGVLAVIAAFLRPPGHSRPAVAGGRIFRELTADPGIVLLFLAGAGAIGLGVGSSGVISTFATGARGWSDDRAQFALALYLIGMASGRIVIGLAPRHDRPGRIAVVASGAAFVASALLYLVRLPDSLILPLAFILGLAVAPLLPLTIAAAGLRYRHVAGTAMGVVKLAIPFGGIVVPGLFGLIADTVSFTASLYLFPASAIVFLLATVLGECRVSRSR